MLIVFVIRTKLPVWKSSRPGKNLVIATLVVTALILILPYTTFGTLLNFAPLPLPVLLSLFGVIALYLISGEIVKYFFYRKVKL